MQTESRPPVTSLETLARSIGTKATVTLDQTGFPHRHRIPESRYARRAGWTSSSVTLTPLLTRSTAASSISVDTGVRRSLRILGSVAESKVLLLSSKLSSLREKILSSYSIINNCNSPQPRERAWQDLEAVVAGL